MGGERGSQGGGGGPGAKKKRKVKGPNQDDVPSTDRNSPENVSQSQFFWLTACAFVVQITFYNAPQFVYIIFTFGVSLSV